MPVGSYNTSLSEWVIPASLTTIFIIQYCKVSQVGHDAIRPGVGGRAVNIVIPKDIYQCLIFAFAVVAGRGSMDRKS